MILTAALCWFDEEPETLDRCVRAIGAFADRIVAVDGAYARWPISGDVSDPEQAETIKAAAKATNTEARIVIPTRRWAGQVEKRNALMGLATEGSDWVCVVDADHVAHGHAEQVRVALERSEWLVHTVPYSMPLSARPLDESASSLWHVNSAGQIIPTAHFFRALPEFRVELHHWCYSAMWQGQRWSLWGGETDRRYPVAAQVPLPAPYDIEHLALARDEKHILANRAYLNDREDVVLALTGQEDDRPDLPRPVYDYVRLTNA